METFYQKYPIVISLGPEGRKKGCQSLHKLKDNEGIGFRVFPLRSDFEVIDTNASVVVEFQYFG